MRDFCLFAVGGWGSAPQPSNVSPNATAAQSYFFNNVSTEKPVTDQVVRVRPARNRQHQRGDRGHYKIGRRSGGDGAQCNCAEYGGGDGSKRRSFRGCARKVFPRYKEECSMLNRYSQEDIPQKKSQTKKN